MSFLTFFKGAIIGLFIFSAFFSLFLSIKNIERKINRTYFYFALFMAAGLIFNYMRYFCVTPEDFGIISKITSFLLTIAVSFFIFLISHLTGYKSNIFNLVFAVLIITLALINVFSSYGVIWADVEYMEKSIAVFGEKIFMPVGTVSKWQIPVILMLFLIFIYTIFAARHKLKSEQKEGSYILIISVGLGLLGIILERVVLIFEKIQILVIDDIGFIGFMILVGYINFSTVFKIFKIQNELEQNEVKYRTLFQNSGDGIMIMENGIFTDCNSKALELFNCTKEELINKSPIVFSPEYQPDETLSQISALNKIKQAYEGNDLNFEWLHKRKDGSLFNAEVSLTKFTHNNQDKLQARVRDITINKGMESQLRSSEFRFRTLVEGMNEAVIQVDDNDYIVFINNKFTEILGYEETDVIGLNSYNLLLDPSDREFIKQTDLLRRKNIVSQYEINIKSKRGDKFVFLVSGSPVYNAEGNFIGTFAVMTDITERKAAENALRTIIDSSPFGAYSYKLSEDGNLYFSNYNKSAVQLINIDYESMLNKPIEEVFPEVVEKGIPHIYARIAKGEIKNYEDLFEYENGSVFQFFAFNTGENNMTVFFIDTTEKRKIEKSVMLERQNFLRVFEEAPIPMQIMTSEKPRQRLAVNQAMADMFGVEKEEFLNLKTIGDYEPGHFLYDLYAEVSQKFQEQGFLENYLVVLNLKQKGKRYILVTLKPINFNETESILNILQDVTEIEQTKEELQATLNYIQFLVDSIQSAIIAVDIDLNVTHYNKAALVFDTNITDDKFIFSKFPKLKFIEETLSKYINNPTKKDNFVYTFENPFGKYHFYQVTISLMKSEQKPGFLIIIEDMTEQKKIDELMIQSEKMMSVAGLAAGMAHEINNPLGTIVQGCQNLVRRTTNVLQKNEDVAVKLGIQMEMIETYMKQRQVYDIIESMKSAAGKAAEIIKNMLQFSRRSESKKVNYNIIKLIDEALELAYNDYDLKKKFDFRSINLIKEYGEPVPEIKLTVTEIEQVIFNILRNAAQAFHEENDKTKIPQIIFRVYTEQKYLVIEIEDNGPGIHENIHKRIFEPFFTTKEIGEGTGLGLSVSYMIVKNNHDGILTVKSAPGKGASFTIKLPL